MPDVSVVEQQGLRAELHDPVQLVRDDDERDLPPAHLFDMPERLPLKCGIAHRQDFVDDQDVRIEVRCNGESESRVHSTGIALDRRVDELLHPGERDNFIESRRDLGAVHAHDRALQKHVLPAREIRVKTGAKLNQRANASVQRARAPRRPDDARE